MASLGPAAANTPLLRWVRVRSRSGILCRSAGPAFSPPILLGCRRFTLPCALPAWFPFPSWPSLLLLRIHSSRTWPPLCLPRNATLAATRLLRLRRRQWAGDAQRPAAVRLQRPFLEQGGHGRYATLATVRGAVPALTYMYMCMRKGGVYQCSACVGACELGGVRACTAGRAGEIGALHSTAAKQSPT